MSSAHTISMRVPGSGERAYGVHVGRGLLASVDAMVREACGSVSRMLIVADAGVPEATREGVRRGVARLVGADARVATHLLQPSEAGKSLETLHHVLLACARARLDRSDVVLSLGGGIVGDVAGFAGATYRRGVRWVNCPTTLLAMVDASVGGKTGVNLAIGTDPRDPASFDLLKNMVGAFHQPSLVIADCDVLASLPEATFRAGLGECIKHAMIAESVLGAAGRGERERLADRLAGLRAVDIDSLADFVAWNVALKAKVVQDDPFETAPDATGGRALLNLGHTFAHAIEATSADAARPIEHGQAVALGLIAATATSAALGMVPRGLVDETRAIVLSAGLRDRSELAPDGALLLAMGHDKKVVGGKRRLVLPTGRETARIVVDASEEAVLSGWRTIREQARG